ncbi:MAG TPA: response regulator, partial [Pyrinomonadaceae bacterium]|nr:response regulator [Pyrinomonadaceae bacterium]
MIPGRTLLLADDSVAIQKVIDLTFTDEGMQVITTGDGQDALEKLNQSKPDVVLADVFMPGIDGYELCKFIKQSEQFRGVPVMLLVGSFEPFDEAEAKRAGADDVVTKPFQSIRDLVSRVGSLVSRAHPNVQTDTDDDDSTFAVETQSTNEPAEEHYATSEIDQERVTVSEAEAVDQAPRVFVEAAVMETPEMEAEHTCPPDIELQTADTQQLEPVHTSNEEDSEPVEVEIVPEAQSAYAAESGDVVTVGEFEPDQLVSEEMKSAPAFDDDGVLDLGDVDSFTGSGASDDFELDVDVAPVQFSSPTKTADEDITPEGAHPYEAMLETAAVPTEKTVSEPLESVEGLNKSSTGDLSAAAIEAISRRVVEQLSDKVVREIA